MEARVISEVSRRIVPFVALCYFLCYLDRVNIGFAALQMNNDLGFTATMFGWGAGIFFFGYFIFEAPSNLALERFGARLWIARIMVTWGLLSAGMALIWNEWSFLVVRFLLGAAEAGFFFPDPVQKMTALSIWSLPDRTAVLDLADRVSQRYRCCRRHRADKFDRQPRRFCRPLRHGLSEGRDRRLYCRASDRRVFPFLSAILVLALGHNPALERGAIPEGAH